jgi:cation diffusion facilitator family transporter
MSHDREHPVQTAAGPATHDRVSGRDHATASTADPGHAHGHGGAGHGHGGVDAAILGSREAMRTLGLSLVILGITTALQLVVVVLSGSIALLADTVHNFGDALTAVPLAAAYALGRRPATRRLTYGWGRFEDFAGIVVVLIILFSAAVAAYAAIDRLIHPQTPTHLVATAIAGVIGFIGNEWVSVYRIRSGRRIGSAALEADGYHARVDGYTSLAVVVGVIGVALGFRLADQIVGLLISAAILRIVWSSIREIGLRALDGVDPALVENIRDEAAQVPGVVRIDEVRARWLGHVVRTEVTLEVGAEQSVRDANRIVDAVRHRIIENVRYVAEAAVRARPAG